MPTVFYDVASIWFGLQGVSLGDFIAASSLGLLAVKTPLKCVLVLVLFSKPHMELLLALIRTHLPKAAAAYTQAWLLMHRGNLEPSLGAPLRYDIGVWAWQALVASICFYLLIVYVHAVANRHR
jgi:hypothetical protein